jgi:hypothetical protein
MENTFKVFDAIAKEFDSQFSFDLLLEKRKFKLKTYFEYKYDYEYYLATAKTRKFHKKSENKEFESVAKQLIVKFPYKHSWYFHSCKYTIIVQRGFNEFYILKQDVLEKMPFISQLKERLNCQIIFYYSILFKRADICFKDLNGLCPLIISFKKGYPIDIEQKEWEI